MSDLGLTESDRRLLRALQDDATLSHKALAEKVGMSASSVWRRLKDFEAAGVIRERVTLLDPARLGLDICVIIHVNVVCAQVNRAVQQWEYKRRREVISVLCRVRKIISLLRPGRNLVGIEVHHRGAKSQVWQGQSLDLQVKP